MGVILRSAARGAAKRAAERALEGGDAEVICAAPVEFTRTPKDPSAPVAASRVAVGAVRGLVARACGGDDAASTPEASKKRVLAVVRPANGSKDGVDDMLLLMRDVGASQADGTIEHGSTSTDTITLTESEELDKDDCDVVAKTAKVDSTCMEVDPQLRQPPVWFDGLRALAGGAEGGRARLLTAKSVIVSHPKARDGTGAPVPRAFTITPTGNARAPFTKRRWLTPAFGVAVAEGRAGDELAKYLEREVRGGESANATAAVGA